MTRRAGVWATTEVGRHVHSVAWAAKELGVTWHTVMDAITLWGEVLVEHPDRVSATTAIGVEETSFLAATATEETRWVSSICDVEGRSVIDVIEGRQAPDLDRWLTDQADDWKSAVTITVCDLQEPFPRSAHRHLPDATTVADPSHVVAVGGGRWLDGLIEDCRDARAAEVRGVARTLNRWRDQILAWHTSGAERPYRRPELHHQEGEAGRSRLPVIRQLPAADSAGRRGMQLVAPRRCTPLKREGPLTSSTPRRTTRDLSNRQGAARVCHLSATPNHPRRTDA